jgi:hypothetical protein
MEAAIKNERLIGLKRRRVSVARGGDAAPIELISKTSLDNSKGIKALFSKGRWQYHR